MWSSECCSRIHHSTWEVLPRCWRHHHGSLHHQKWRRASILWRGLVKYQAKQSEGDFFHALCASTTASCQFLATGTSAKHGPSLYECPTTCPTNSNCLGSPQGDQEHQHCPTSADRL